MDPAKNIFSKRGITPPWESDGQVARAQGFVRYEGAGWRERRAAIAEHEPLYSREDSPDESKRLRRVREDRIGREGEGLVHAPGRSRSSWSSWLAGALSEDGWLMPRHAIMPDHEDSDFRFAPTAQLRPDVPVNGHFRRHAHRQLRGRLARTQHSESICDLAPPGHPAAIEHPEGAFLPSGHLHPRTGELVVPVEGYHRHWTDSKYLYTPGNSARRLGTNPLNVERGFKGDLFVIVMEGTLKMCAVTEAGFPCIDAGSVTLWDSQAAGEEGMVSELNEFAARHLEGRAVAVVCDSDWFANDAVRVQTEKVTEIVNRHGAHAVACAPPEGPSFGWCHRLTGVEQCKKRGVDDWLGEHKPRDRHEALLDLVWYEHAGHPPLTADHPALAGLRRDGRETTAAMLRQLGAWASPDGVAPYAERRLMDALGRAKETVQRARREAVGRGLLEELTEADLRPRTDGTGVFSVAPLVRVVPEAMPVWRERRLRDLL